MSITIFKALNLNVAALTVFIDLKTKLFYDELIKLFFTTIQIYRPCNQLYSGGSQRNSANQKAAHWGR